MIAPLHCLLPTESKVRLLALLLVYLASSFPRIPFSEQTILQRSRAGFKTVDSGIKGLRGPLPAGWSRAVAPRPSPGKPRDPFLEGWRGEAVGTSAIGDGNRGPTLVPGRGLLPAEESVKCSAQQFPRSHTGAVVLFCLFLLCLVNALC